MEHRQEGKLQSDTHTHTHRNTRLLCGCHTTVCVGPKFEKREVEKGTMPGNMYEYT